MATDAVPNIPDQKIVIDNKSVKIATPDLIIKDSDVMSIDIMTDLIFEDIGGQELATISRHDIVNGQKVLYNPIKNLTDLYFQYNPNNILSIQSSDSYFKSLPLSVLDHFPVCGNGYDLIEKSGEPDKNKWTKVANCKSVYVDPISGDLVINLIDVKDGEQVEVQILTSGQVFDDTIYDGGN